MATSQSEPDSESAIRALKDAFVRHFNTGDADRAVRAFYAEDARLLAPDAPIIAGRAQIRDALQAGLAAGMGDLSMEISEIEVAGSGDLAYGIGAFSLTRPEPRRGKFITVFRRQADGSWRCVADSSSPNEATS